MRKAVFTGKAPQPKSPYSQGIIADGPMVYVSGTGPFDPVTNELRCGTFREQARLVFENLGAVLEAAGTSFENVVRVGAFLTDFANWDEYNEIYKQYFSPPYPVRVTLEARLGGEIAIEVDCIAVVSEEE